MHEDCLYKSICHNECKEACIRYSEMHFLLQNSNIPLIRQKVNELIPEDCDLSAYNILADIRKSIVDFTQNGEQLYIYSENCGNGKTTWSIKLMLQYFNEIWAGNGFVERGIFIHIPTFLNMCKAVINKPDADFEHLREMLPKVDLVIWDEIASSKLSEYDYNLLLLILDQRVLNGKSNIFTGNIKPDNLVQFVGSKIASRMSQNCTYIELTGGDMR